MSELQAQHTDTPSCSTLRTSLALGPARLSLLTAGTAMLIHPLGGVPLSQPISLELHEGSPIAYLSLLGLLVVNFMFGTRFLQLGHRISGLCCLLCAALLIVIPLTHPYSDTHFAAYFGVVVLTMLLSLLWALDSCDLLRFLPPFLPLAFGLPCYVAYGIGGFQLLLIGSLLLAMNLTADHLESRACQ